MDTLTGQEISLQESLHKYFGFDSFKGDQEAIINSLLDGHDTFVIMPTGGGKSMCYQLPALISEGTAIIISPLIALMKNQVDSIRNYGSEDNVAHFLNSSLSKSEIIKVKKDVSQGKTKLLYVAPESLTKEENINFLKDIRISFFAIDEAHCISEWGHDFRPEYRRLRAIIEAIGTVPIIALTATATPKVQQDIQKNLGMQNANVFKSSFNRSNLYYEVRPKQQVIREIIKYVKQHPGKSGIIYCLSRKKVEEIAETLQVNGIKALPYHAGLDAAQRASHQDKFLMEEVDIIVATIAFGMGIDKPDVRYVIHHDIPKSLEGYYQETGRAGRDGGEGNCVAFYSYDDIVKLEKFMKGKPVSEQEIGKQLLVETTNYAESSVCRRKLLLHYFGESFDAASCNNMCDNCRHPRKKFEAEDDLFTVLETVEAVKEKFKAKHISTVIVGISNSNTKSYKHEALEVFGKGADKDEKFWNSVIRQAIVNDFLSKDIENYGLLKLSNKGRAFLKAPHPIQFTEDIDYETSAEDDEVAVAGGKGGGALDDTLFNMLKDLRKKIAKAKGLPPFVIFQDPSLEDMSISYPVNLEELKNISGVGSGKAQRFGQEFVDLIARYVKENDIERPMDMVVKSVVNKSLKKVYIIQSIDRKMDLEDIASAKGMTFDELLTELENIIASGTRLNLSYYIDEAIDEEKQEEVFDYFKTAETDSIAEAFKELGEDDYTEEEIRLMRIRFISEMGN
ncbi:MAG: DNA helicase RecQ [Bacteroidota bacterium]